MAKIEVLLNGNKIQAEDNITILDLARNNNIEIPTLCKDPRLKPITSCFLCVVEVKGAKTLTPSCSTYLTNGMEINTNTDRVMEARRTALELILSNHYGDCIAPCKLACPAGCDVQGYVGLIANGRYKEAIRLIKDTIPLPAAIGRVCPKFCEDKCRRQLVDKPIAIDYLKRFAADIDLSEEDSYMPDLKSKIGKKVAVIGGGPAGLSCAYYLVQEGVDVEIFEAKSTLGGMLVYGIPEYRLPKELTAKEIDLIVKLGVKVNLNKRLGKDFTIDDLKKQGFDAVLLSMGAWKSRKMDVENENTEGVFDGIKYLEELNEGKNIRLNGRVAIVGGGNTAFDCARTALRIGASEVVVVYRRTRDEMPANDIEIIEAEEEGIKYQFLTAPVKIISEGGKLIGMECVKMKLGEPDASGRRSPVVIEGSNFIEKFDYVIAAVGQSPDYSYLGDYKEKLLKGGRWINFNKDTMQTDVDFIFTAGDYAIGAATVVEALATGKKACNSLVKFLKNEKLDVKKEFVSTRDEFNEITEEFLSKWSKQERQKPDILPPEIRKHSFDEIEDVFTEEQALIESKRCMECGCMDVYQCDLKKYSTEYDAKETKYLGDFNRFKDDASHEFIYREPEKCILCGGALPFARKKLILGFMVLLTGDLIQLLGQLIMTNF
jgi:formate dehydrogenase major subunit